MSPVYKPLSKLTFDNSYVQLPEHFYHRVNPVGLKNAHLISFNPAVAELLDLNPCEINPSQLAQYFGGGELLEGSEPLAMKYAGHQFGYYNPDLGDGRGLLLGEVINSQNERWDLHLKGAGKTAFSRMGDGKAVLRSSIREYLVSAAMTGLGIPTTQALSLVGSETYTMREGMEPCAQVLRVSQCHIRFGHFEHFYHRRMEDDLKILADYCLDRFYPVCKQASNPYLAMFHEIRDRSLSMVAKWQAYGFVHGVMNTDNMSILGETFDYGPYTFMDTYDPNFVSSHTDEQGRYAFKNQPNIMGWNLSCLAQSLVGLIPKEGLIEALDECGTLYDRFYYGLMRHRLGLLSEETADKSLIDQLNSLCAAHHVDQNRFLRDLSRLNPEDDATIQACLLHAADPSALTGWLSAYSNRIDNEATIALLRQRQMQSANPVYLLRNYMAEEAIREAHQGDYRLVNTLLAVLRNPFVEKDEYERYAAKPPEWAGGICLSCSS
ncbi:YdiU family protein [Neptunomonas phycophila]|uniref:protein adenylyltransferase SelO n=1 Tax=Neptunomonas phycophila TaxID=1572645 RepID=UPI0026E438AA|nr:YdiU family protein [Neptunomonas phycophila]MDO6466870.1 YdiU family protein [Neptunomonas phycophila]